MKIYRQSNTKRNVFFLSSSFYILFFFLSCGPREHSNPFDPEYSGSNSEVILKENVIIIEEANLSKPVVKGDTLIFTFTGVPPDIKIGDVLVSKGDFSSLNKLSKANAIDLGFLRKVTDVIIEAGTMIVLTNLATLLDIFFKIDIDTVMSVQYGELNNLTGTTIFDEKIGITDINGEIVNGSITLDLKLFFRLKISNGLVDELKITVGGEVFVENDVKITATAAIKDKIEKRLLQAPPFGPFMVGGVVPVIVNISVFAGVDFDIGVVGSVEVGFDATTSLEVGAEYFFLNGRWQHIWEPNFEANYHPVQWDLGGFAKARAYLSPRIELLIAGAIGPRIEVEPFVRFDGEISLQDWQWELYAGFDGNLDIKIGWLSDDLFAYETNLIRREKLIQSNSGTFANTPPTASFTINPTSGTSSTTFDFDASSSTDLEDPTSALQVRWDWENDGVWDEPYSTKKTARHKYTSEGTKAIKMEVKDTGGLTSSTTRQIDVENDQTNGLIAYFPFDGNANDESGNGYNGIEYGKIQYVSGIKGQAVSFDGIDDWIDIGQNHPFIADTKEFTIASWYKADSSRQRSDHMGMVVLARTNGSGCAQLSFGGTWATPANQHNTHFYVSDYRNFCGSGNHGTGTFKESTPINEWVFLVGILENGEMRLYIDGNLVNSQQLPETVVKRGRLQFGYLSNSYNNRFEGVADELQIYNRALSESEIKSLYNSFAGN